MLPELYWAAETLLENGSVPIPPELEGNEELVEEIKGRIARINDLVAWDKAIFSHYCSGQPKGDPMSSEYHPVPAEVPSVEELIRGNKYLKLIEDQMALVDSHFDCRQILQDNPELLFLAGGNPDSARLAMGMAESVPKNDGLSGWEYLRLGEIHGAFSAAKEVFTGVSRVSLWNPFFNLPRIHLSTTRLEVIAQGEGERLGKQVLPRIKIHLDGCGACSGAFKRVQRSVREDSLAVPGEDS